jgi:hypothetical protein
MGSKTSPRRKHLKRRYVMATIALEDPFYRHKRVEPRVKKESTEKRRAFFKRLRIDSEEFY